MSEQQWKRNEREIASRLGGQRIPVSGRAGKPDIDHKWLAVEVKLKRRLPIWLKSALFQAEVAARPGQLPVTILHELGARHDDDIVLVRLRDFREWFGDPRW